MSTRQQLTHLGLRLSPLPSVLSLHAIKEPSTLQGSAQMSPPRELTLTMPHFTPSNLVIPLRCHAEATVSNQGTCVTGCAGKRSPRGQRVSRSTSHVRPLSENWRYRAPHTASRTGPSPSRGGRKAAPSVPRRPAARPESRRARGPAQGGRPPRACFPPVSLTDFKETRDTAAATPFPPAL